MLNDLPRQKLCEIVIHYDKAVWQDPQRCRGLLKDLCEDQKYWGDIDGLVDALTEGVVNNLQTQQSPLALLLPRLVARLRADRHFTEDFARYVVEAWAEALRGYQPEPRPRLPQQLTVSSQGRGQYRSIAEAIKDAYSGDTILVCPGRYTEGLILDKHLRIIGDAPRREEIIIDCGDAPCIQMQTESAEIDGLALHCRANLEPEKYGAVTIAHGQLQLSNCDISASLAACITI